MPMREHLKPCPFCGGDALYGIVGVDSATDDDPNFGGRYIRCEGCDTSTRLMFPLKDDVDGQLRELWNARSEKSEIADKMLEMLCLAVERYMTATPMNHATRDARNMLGDALAEASFYLETANA